jgi:hypothetical protein
MMHRDIVNISVIFDSKAAYHPGVRRESVRSRTKPVFLKHAGDADFSRTIAVTIHLPRLEWELLGPIVVNL